MANDSETPAKAEEGAAPAKKPRFPYAAYFREVDVMPALQMAPEELPWMQAIPDNPAPRDMVFYLGCQALKTPHFVLEAMDLLRALDLDFATIGGPANCCGSVHQNFGKDYAIAEKVSASATDRIMAFKPNTVLTVCPNCTHQYENVVSKKTELPFEMTHFYDFILERAAQLNFTRRLDLRVGLHRHLGNSHHQDRHGAICAEVLGRIPGITVVDLPAYPELQHLCYMRAVRGVPDERYEEMMEEMFGAARAAGCDVVATIYHACQRELCHEEQRGPFKVRSVLGILGEAMGFPPREDKILQYKQMGDIEAVMRAVEPNRIAHGIAPDVARAVLTSVLKG